MGEPEKLEPVVRFEAVVGGRPYEFGIDAEARILVFVRGVDGEDRWLVFVGGDADVESAARGSLLRRVRDGEAELAHTRKRLVPLAGGGPRRVTINDLLEARASGDFAHLGDRALIDLSHLEVVGWQDGRYWQEAKTLADLIVALGDQLPPSLLVLAPGRVEIELRPREKPTWQNLADSLSVPPPLSGEVARWCSAFGEWWALSDSAALFVAESPHGWVRYEAVATDILAPLDAGRERVFGELLDAHVAQVRGRCAAALAKSEPSPTAESRLKELRAGWLAKYGSARRQPWSCAARRAITDPPQDCAWPLCGCDERAAEVVEALTEAGWRPGGEPEASPATASGGE